MKDNTKKHIKIAALFIALAVIIEVFGFNYEWLFSLGDKSEVADVAVSQDFIPDGENRYIYPEHDIENEGRNVNNPSFEISGINKAVDYVYINVTPEYEGELNEGCFDVYMIDEGFSEYYYCNTVKLHPSFEKTKYIRLHSYGDVKAIKLVTNYDNGLGRNTDITLNGIELNANVPMFFSPLRFFIMIAIFVFIYMFRPSSSLYKYNALDNNKKLRMLRMLFMGVNVILFALLIANNLTLANPSNATFRQYNMLAESIAQGRVNIDVGYNDIIETLKNPYDLYERRAALRQYNLFVEREPWHDIAYFEGNYYVYFGIVPELIFYLPLYLIAKTQMVTSAAFFLVCCLIVVAAYSFSETLVKCCFKNTSFGVCLFSSAVLANAVGTLMFIMVPTIYYIVIVTGILFVILGLNMWLKARCLIDEKPDSKKIELYIALGALFMALVAGCRPSMVLSSFLIIPIFWDVAVKGKRIVFKGNTKRYISAAVPYILVAAGLMYYNFIRFGSPFDFGANYNLTTNDMNLRGFNLARLVDGVYMYVFEPPTITAKFPYLRIAAFGSDYFGYTFAETIYGGILFTSCISLFLFMLRRAKDILKKKRLYSVILFIIGISVVTMIADIEMGGLNARYAGDFLYLVIIGAVIVMLALFEKYGHTKRLVSAMLVLGTITLAMHFFITFNTTSLQAGSTEGYFNIYNLFI